ncbi:group-specific protein [Brachyspira hyodysenteriae]|uniref:group-specific protein n=1 Tax=Brachyspira hyodysenteriae TaxID=159 RepID=UPI0022CD8EAB|nr:group-specific protein [Brachyspira hyodysenteriae]MCZ9892311.1 group-specific protein [Brachyspira hyodysenteriae]MCZ9989857.1 group-specific protein [Brachyspira hyodysenteriae]MCZ9998226.1 group-specific protein [Brachyspira hyodysenteriae]MDA0001660.1 group-specific protein [Brachyspira hyodysenteriae]MDA0001679.1 group-specific protein [Brachyspira hyodysenteriae]
MIVYQIGSISFGIFSVICIFISIANKNIIGKAFYLLCFFLSNITALLCDIVIKLN